MIARVVVLTKAENEISRMLFVNEHNSAKLDDSLKHLEEKEMFLFKVAYKQNEYIQQIRLDLEKKNNDEVKIVACQVQTSIGRRSEFYNYRQLTFTSEITRLELIANAGEMIIGVDLKNKTIAQIKIPVVKKKKISNIILSSSSLLKDEGKSLLSTGVMKDVVNTGVARKFLFSKSNDGESFIRLMLDGTKEVELPQSVNVALNCKGKNFKHSLLEIMCKKNTKNRWPALIKCLFEKKKCLNNQSMVEKLFRSEHLPTLIFQNNSKGGGRSVLQLLTDDESLDDLQCPSILRLLLKGEEEEEEDKKSILRILAKPDANNISLLDEMILGNTEKEMLLSKFMEGDNSIALTFLSDTPSGKPSLAKYVIGGSLMRLLIQGEESNQKSLFRLLLIKNKKHSLFDLLTMHDNSTEGVQESLLSILLKGENSARESSIAREAVGSKFSFKNGVMIVSRENFGIDGGKEKKTIEEDGITAATLFMLGEIEIGISFFRFLLLGEAEGRNSILRLLMFGESEGEISPLRILFNGLYATLSAAQKAKTSVDYVGKLKKAVEAVAEVEEGLTWREKFYALVNGYTENENFGFPGITQKRSKIPTRDQLF